MSQNRTSHQDLIVHEYLAAIISFASHRAEMVHHFLIALGVKATPEEPVSLPGWFLADLSHTLVLYRWERAGIAHALDASFPRAGDLILTLIADAENPDTPVDRQPNQALEVQILRAYLRSCSWTANQELRSEMRIHVDPGTDFVEALAQFLWSKRRRNSPA